MSFTHARWVLSRGKFLESFFGLRHKLPTHTTDAKKSELNQVWVVFMVTKHFFLPIKEIFS